MDRTQRENQHTLTELIDAQFLKKVTKFLLPISMFSLLFSHTSLLPLLHSYNFYLSTFLYQLFTHTIDKSCIFLLCNGLLVFLAKYSGLVRCLSTSSSYEESYSKIIMDGSQSESTPMQRIEEFVDKEVVVVESTGSIESASIEEGSSDHEKEKVEDKQEQEQERSGFFVSNEVVEEETPLEQVVEEEEDEEKWAKGGFYIEQRGEEEEAEEEEEEEEKGFEEEEEEGNGRLSTEELNKKFDDFIRRMKEELRIEAQRHLIMV
ncbi:hypothetical protein UlMin_003849 [Ulmus minor]